MKIIVNMVKLNKGKNINESGLKSHQKKEIKHNYLIYSVLQRMINQF